jgi:cyclohexadieny/prephenate dehydrogenase
MPEQLGPPLAEPLVDTLTLIGFGLQGSSIARAVRRKNIAQRIVAADRSPSVRERAGALGIVDEIYESNSRAVGEADVVILCAPVGANAGIGGEVGTALKPGAIVSDVGSVKGAVLRDLAPTLPRHVHLVPAHPVAGTENSGPDAGFATLFVNRWCILTPPEGADAGAVALVRSIWEAMGANVETMSADHHDLVLAITSHVPHLVAYNIVGTAADLEAVTRSEVIKFSAGGFRDFTRLAASDPTMWRDVFLNNRAAVLEILGRFTEDLIALQRSIRWAEGEKLFELFTRTRAIRRGIIEIGQETPEPDFGRHRGDDVEGSE